MVPEEAITPDVDAIRRDLEYMTARWREVPEDCVMELRAFREHMQPQTVRYSPDLIEDAAEWAADMNERGYNTYVVRNPISARVRGSASDSDIVAAFFLWADCDDGDAASNVKKWTGPKYSAAVITGRTPAPRVHTYWQLAEPCFDLAKWRRCQESIAAHFGSDRTVVNPSRIMRIGGTVSYPFEKKRQRGYQIELVKFRTDYPDERPPVTLDQMQRAFGATAHALQSASDALQIDTGPQPLDRERTRIQALSGQEWHNAVIRLVASYVSKGLSDDEIHGLTAPLTLPGYTPDQTHAEVQTAIDGARRKGWTPDPQPEELTPAQIDEIPALDFKPWGARDLAAIPYPEFLYSDFYARGYTSVTLAAPKVGKSMLGLAEAVDIASGRGFLAGQQREKLRVVYYNAEDDMSVIESRVSALLTLYNIDQSEIGETLFPVSGVDKDDFFLISGQDGIINERLFVSLEKFIRMSGADVLIFDPLQDLSRSPETNEVFRLLGQRIRRMASEMKVALGIVHHTRKVAPGMTPTIDDGRGGSALRGTARFNRLLISMSEDEAAKAGVPNHKNFMRIGDAESNLAPPSSDVNRWFEKVSVPTPNGREVGAVKPWTWPDAFEGVTNDQARRCQRAVQDSDPRPRQNVQARNWVGHVVAPILGMDPDQKADRARLAAIVKKWIETDVLAVETIYSARDGRDLPVVVAGKNTLSETA